MRKATLLRHFFCLNLSCDSMVVARFYPARKKQGGILRKAGERARMTRAAQPEGDAPAGTKSTMGKSRDATQDAVSDAILEPIEEKLNHRVSCERKGAAGLSPAAPSCHEARVTA
jgi:hypothetical protein